MAPQVSSLPNTRHAPCASDIPMGQGREERCWGRAETMASLTSHTPHQDPRLTGTFLPLGADIYLFFLSSSNMC